MTALLGACGTDADDGGTLSDLQLVGIDFELNSIILTNEGSDEVLIQGLWRYQNGESSQFDPFIVEPRATILFSVRDIGGVDSSGGEIALFTSDSFSDADAMLDYVVWGTSGHDRIDLATDAALWPDDETVDTEDDTVVILRGDPNSIGPDAWAASSVIP